MKIIVSKDAESLGKAAAALAAQKISAAVGEHGSARILLSTGASQFETLNALLASDVDWSKVTMFHLDEYIGLPESHKASFRKYLKERFVSKVPLARAVFVDGEGDVRANIERLNAEIESAPIDVGVVGIGVNGHIAFNDPPADFETRQSYKIVDLDEKCKEQQVGEGWFAAIGNVPRQAVTMTPYRIMRCKSIVSAVPHLVKAEAIRATLEGEVTNLVPATLLKTHADWTLFIDNESASLCRAEMLAME
ncbi:MAG: 6-phosphogluconolactonase [Defluviitaleaceae bacterium]|nr:6-phosphogluconolactonase [Defluviitaleaceae bacterium]